MKKVFKLMMILCVCMFFVACGNNAEPKQTVAASGSSASQASGVESGSNADVSGTAGKTETTTHSPSESSTTTAMTNETDQNKPENGVKDSNTSEIEQTNTSEPEQTNTSEPEQTNAKTLVVYFSCTGNTKAIAQHIADITESDIYEIVPKQPYTSEDLNYNDNKSRSTKEMNDSTSRPEISGTVDHFEQYETVYIGYPIWWGEAPRILDTFVESYDFSNKTIIPFCTSGGSGVGSSAKTLEKLAGNGNWMDGKKFRGNEDMEAVSTWVNGL